MVVEPGSEVEFPVSTDPPPGIAGTCISEPVAWDSET